jgi:hypothetical protein
MTLLINLLAIIAIVLMLLLLTRRLQNGRTIPLRPLTGYTALAGQLGRAIESGRRLHVSLGRATLAGAANPTSIAASNVLDRLAQDGCANATPPLTTVGEGTLLPLAQASVRRACDDVGRPGDFEAATVQFIATDTDPFAYAAGVTATLQQNRIASNVLVGRFGLEVAIMAEAASRQEMEQVIGTDDPVALALATAATSNVLIGEELFVASAYLEGRANQLASVQLQDILRWLIILTILGLSVYQLVT